MMIGRILVGLLALLWVSTSAEAGPQLTTAQISALAPGYYTGTWKGKRQLHLKLSPDGTISGTIDGARHSGKWYVDNGNLCLVFRILALQKTKCGTIHRDGGWLMGYYKKGKPRLRLKPVEGTKV
jgi:hypothetical protein